MLCSATLTWNTASDFYVTRATQMVCNPCRQHCENVQFVSIDTEVKLTASPHRL